MNNGLESYLATEASALTPDQRANAGFASDVIPQKPVVDPLADVKLLSHEEYWNTMDPDTGRRFIIPFLNPTKEGYRETYIELMIMRHRDPKAFDTKVMMR